MKFYLQIAWRNLWRNKRRTLLAVSSIFFAVVFTLFIAALNYGQDDDLVRMSVSLSTGYLQVQGKGYWEERSFDESFVVTDSLLAFLQEDRRIRSINPRIESVALISHDLNTRISPVLGIDPEWENRMTGLRKRVVRGKYLEVNSRGILLADGLAGYLQVDVGDSVVVFTQGYQGVTAAEHFTVEGILHFPIPKMNQALAYLALRRSQLFFNAIDRVTSVSLMIDEENYTESIRSDLSAKLGDGLVVMSWKEMAPEIVQTIVLNDAGSMLILSVFYIVIGFGVFGTVMMMTIERTREFGLLISLGMTRGRLFLISAVESVLVSMTGALAGLAVAAPVVIYFHHHPFHLSGELARIYVNYGFEPIMSVNADPGLFYSQTLVVFSIAVIASLYPLRYLQKIKPVQALQGRGGG